MSARFQARLFQYYPIVCVLPYLPAACYELGLFQELGWSVAMNIIGVSMLIIITSVMFNLIVGCYLLYQCSGAKRLMIFVASLFGAVFPIAGIIAEQF